MRGDPNRASDGRDVQFFAASEANKFSLLVLGTGPDFDANSKLFIATMRDRDLFRELELYPVNTNDEVVTLRVWEWPLDTEALRFDRELGCWWFAGFRVIELLGDVYDYTVNGTLVRATLKQRAAH